MLSAHDFQKSEKFLIFFTSTAALIALMNFSFRSVSLIVNRIGQDQLGIQTKYRPFPCLPRPSCADGVSKSDGSKFYCFPPNFRRWCPKPIRITPSPTTSVIEYPPPGYNL